MQVIIANLRHAFRVRMTEWAFAAMLLLWGLSLLLPGPSIFDGPGHVYYVAIKLIADQQTVGMVCFIGGVVRVGVLAANGAWRPMYYIRAWMALSSSVVWLSLSLGFMASGVPGPWMGVYPVLAIFDAINMFRAVSDAALYEKTRNGHASSA